MMCLLFLTFAFLENHCMFFLIRKQGIKYECKDRKVQKFKVNIFEICEIYSDDARRLRNFNEF